MKRFLLTNLLNMISREANSYHDASVTHLNNSLCVPLSHDLENREQVDFDDFDSILHSITISFVYPVDDPFKSLFISDVNCILHFKYGV